MAAPALVPPRPPAHGRLTRYVESIDALAVLPGEGRTVDLLPNGTTTLMVRELGRGVGDATVRGPLTRALYKNAPARVVRVVFRAGGAYPFFGVPVDAITDQLVTLDELWGGDGRRALARTIECFERGGDVITLVEELLLDRLRTRPFEAIGATAARRAVALLADGHAAIADVASSVGVSSRHLRRAFLSTVGAGPKTYARIVRFQRALALGRAHPGRWHEVAQATGYFDQSHLTTDFKEIAGASPGVLERDVARARRGC